MIFAKDSVMALLQEQARMQQGASNLTTIGERLSVLTDEPHAVEERSRLSNQLSDVYEGIAEAQGDIFKHPGAPSTTTWVKAVARLCTSIDELLDQLACADVKSRLWIAKADLVFRQIQRLLEVRMQRLNAVLGSNDQNPGCVIGSKSGTAGKAWGGQLAA